jgi:hypothetical protein
VITPEHKDATAEAIAAAKEILRDLEKLAELLAGEFPLTVERLSNQVDDMRFRELAFLKRFEELQDIVSRKLFRAAALSSGLNPRDYTAVELLDALETVNAITSAETWLMVTAVRNTLVHDYPLNQLQQVSRTNRAWSAYGELRGAMFHVIDFIRTKNALE